MTTLKDFLATASADHSQALTEARAHTENRGRMITSDVMTMLLVNNDLYSEFSDIAADTTSPARGIVMAFMDRVRTNSAFNFRADHPKGQVNLAMVDALVQTLPDLATELGELKTAVIAEASETVTPFANVTLHDVMKERGLCPTTPVTHSDGYIVISVSSDVEQHSPQVYALNERTNNQERINGFRSVGVAGVYECVVPSSWRGAPLSVDDAYGVIESI